jgi:hypothetical protein
MKKSTVFQIFYSQWMSKLSLEKAIVIFAYICPAISTILFVNYFGVDVPHLDDVAQVWDLVSLRDGTASFTGFLSFHNEHRIFFPRIIFVILSRLSGFNLKVEMYFSIFLIATSFYCIFRTSANNVSINKPVFHMTNIITGFILFSFVQYENLLWGFQITWFMVNCFLSLSVLLLSSHHRYPQTIQLMLAGFCCLVATLSSAQGIITWIAVIPSIVVLNGSRKKRSIRLFTWISIFLICFLLYVTGLQKTGFSPALQMLLDKPFLVCRIFVSILGAPFGQTSGSAIVGSTALITFLCFNVHFFRNQSKKIALGMAPWLSFGWFSIFYSIMLVRSRFSFGIGILTGPRYATAAIFLLIACIQLCSVSIQEHQQNTDCRTKFSFPLIFIEIVIAILIFQVNTMSLPEAYATRINRLSSQVCMEIEPYLESSFDNPNFSKWLKSSPNDKSDDGYGLVNSCLDPIYPASLAGKETIRPIIKNINQLGLRSFSNNVLWSLASQSEHGEITSPVHSLDSPGTILDSSKIKLSGWAIMPNTTNQPSVVLFSYDDRKSFFASAFIKLDSPDIAGKMSDSRFSKSRWEVEIPLMYLPEGSRVIKAWIFDEHNNSFFKLNNNVSLFIRKAPNQQP